GAVAAPLPLSDDTGTRDHGQLVDGDDARRRGTHGGNRVYGGHGCERARVEIPGVALLVDAADLWIAVDFHHPAVFNGPVGRQLVAQLPGNLQLDHRSPLDPCRPGTAQAADAALADLHVT